jgi:hypothetical protein
LGNEQIQLIYTHFKKVFDAFGYEAWFPQVREMTQESNSYSKCSMSMVNFFRMISFVFSL